MTWVQTFSGLPFDLLAPRPEDVQIADVAHSLARIARFSGATLGVVPYSVAQHSVLCRDLVALWGWGCEVQREALLHDAAEAYFGDLPAPVLRAVRELGGGDALDGMRARVEGAVRSALGLPAEEHPIVRRADLVALAIERAALMAPCSRDWDLPERADARFLSIVPVTVQVAEAEFLDNLAGIDARIAGRGGL